MAVYQLYIAYVVITSSNDSIIPRLLTMTAIKSYLILAWLYHWRLNLRIHEYYVLVPKKLCTKNMHYNTIFSEQ